MQIDVRQTTIQDAKEIAVLSGQLGYTISVAETASNIGKILCGNDAKVFTALCEGQVAGWIHAFIAVRIETSPFIEIGGLVVAENFRGEGIGKALTAEVKKWCTEKSIHTLRVRCNTRRLEAHKFYAAIGFRQTKEQKILELNV